MKYGLPMVFLGLVASAARGGDLAGYQLLVNCLRTGTPELFVVDPETGDAHNLTHGLGMETRYPMWSPDGAKIAFTAKRGGAWELFLMDADGRNVRALTSRKAVCYMPSWRGDGRQILFGLTEKKSLIASIHPDGSDFRIVGEGLDPCIAPDGKTIVFLRRLERGFCLFAMDADGQKVRQLTKHENAMGAMHPFWTPDSQHVLYSDQVGDKLEIFICDADGANVKQLTKLGAISTSAHMSPDGKWIAFRSTPTPFWSNARESEKVYREKPADRRPVYVMRADGSDPHLIETLHYQVALDGSRPAWRPMPGGEAGGSPAAGEKRR